MYKAFLFFLLLPFIAVAQQKAAPEHALSTRVKNTDSSLVFLAVLRSETLQPHFPPKTFVKYYDPQSHNIKVPNSVLFKEIKKNYDASRDKTTILATLDRWIQNDSLLRKVGAEYETLETPEVLYEDANTKHLFKKHITHKGQSWFSLASWQLYETYIDFMNFAERLTPAKTDALFASLRKTAERLGNAK